MDVGAHAVAERLEEIATALGMPSQSRLREAIEVMRDAVSRFQSGGVFNTLAETRRFAVAIQDGLLARDAFDALMKPPQVQNAERRLRKALDGKFFVPEPVEGDD